MTMDDCWACQKCYWRHSTNAFPVSGTPKLLYTSHARVLSVEFQSAMATPPAPQPVQQPAQQAAPILQEGYIQVCQGYLKRRTTILKRWKKQWFGVAPGEFRPLINYTHHLNILSMVPPVFVPSVLYLPR